jgi:hypothetical protein
MEIARKRKNMNAFAPNSSQIYFTSWVYDHGSVKEMTWKSKMPRTRKENNKEVAHNCVVVYTDEA